MSNKNERPIFEVDKIEVSNYAEIEKKDLKGVLKYKNKVEEFLEHKYKIVILCLVAIIVVEFLLINNKSKLLRMIFLTKDNEFQWLAGTAIAAILTFLFTSINTMSKNKADLVAKARIEWIQEVKKIMAIYLKDVKYYPFLFKKSKLMSKKSSEYQEILNEVNELAVRISENKNLLLLHLSRSDDNKQLNDCIADCSKWISNMRIRWSIQSSGNTKVFKFEYDNTPPNNLLLVSRDYFKREWNKAKKGK